MSGDVGLSVSYLVRIHPRLNGKRHGIMPLLTLLECNRSVLSSTNPVPGLLEAERARGRIHVALKYYAFVLTRGALPFPVVERAFRQRCLT